MIVEHDLVARRVLGRASGAQSPAIGRLRRNLAVRLTIIAWLFLGLSAWRMRDAPFEMVLMLLAGLALIGAPWLLWAWFRASAPPSGKDRCPRCRYDLSGLRDALFPLVVSVRLGPRRCPECGEPWPLIPEPQPSAPMAPPDR